MMSAFATTTASPASSHGETNHMADYDEQLHMERTTLAMEQWPTLNACWGCANCDLIFKQPLNSTEPNKSAQYRCPKCGSESIFDMAAAMKRRSDAAGLIDGVKRAIEELEVVLGDVIP